MQRDRPVAFDEQSEITSQLLAATKVTRWAYSQLSKTNCMPDKAIGKGTDFEISIYSEKL